MNDANIAPLPITAIKDLDKLLRNKPLIRKPINGNKGTKYTKLLISLSVRN